MAVLIPEEVVIAEILTKLPVKSLMRFKCVSKNWMSAISGDPAFIDAHRRQQQTENGEFSIVCRKYKENLQLVCQQRITLRRQQGSIANKVVETNLGTENGPLIIVGSCNGLVCLASDPFHDESLRVLLWNPATRRVRQLPAPANPRFFKTYWFGFGFDSASGDYKVVSLISESSWTRAQVFTRSGSVWRGSEGRAPKELISGVPNCIAVDGALHWELSIATDPQKNILSFNLSDEVFRLVNGPSNCQHFELCTWNSSLAAFDYSVTAPCHLYQAVSSSEGNLCWTKILTFTPENGMHVMTAWREHFLVLRNLFNGEWKMALADPKAPGVVRNFEQLDTDEYDPYNVYDYTETIVSVF